MGGLQHWMDVVEKVEVRTLWIGDLQHWMDEAYIDSCFSHTGEVFTSNVIRNKKTGKSECYGFIVFKSHAIAERFLHKFNGTHMPRVTVGSSNFSLNWASSSFGWGEHQRQEKVDDDLAAAFHNIVTTDNYMLQQQDTFTTSVKEEGANVVTGNGTTPLECFCSTISQIVGVGAPQFPEEMVDISGYENMLKWWSMTQGARTAEAVHATHRVHVIGAFFKLFFTELECVPPARIEELLDELRGYVGSIDVAKELHSISGLDPLLVNLSSKHAGIRAKTANVISTMVHNNPTSQQLVIEAGGDQLLFSRFYYEFNATTVTSIIGAISSLFRNNIHAITAFRQENGYAGLLYGLNTEFVFQRKILNLIRCLVQHCNLHCDIVTELGFPHRMMHLVSSDHAEIREAALECLLVLARVEKGGNSAQLVKNDDKLKQVLEERIVGISEMAPEDLGAARKERQLVDSLLKMLPGEFVPAFDVARELFEPPPRTWAAVVAGDRNFIGEKKEAPIFLAPSAATPSVASKLFKSPLRTWAAVVAGD